MDFQGLTEDDVTNVRALNRAWLQLTADGRERFAVLDEKRRKRLANAPFLLFTLRESETTFWIALLADRRQRELFAECPDAGQRELQIASLALGTRAPQSLRGAYRRRSAAGMVRARRCVSAGPIVAQCG